MKKTLILMLLALAVCLSACAKTPQTNHSADPVLPVAEETAPVPEASPSTGKLPEETENLQQSPAVEDTGKKESADAAQTETDKAPADSTTAPKSDTLAEELPVTTDDPQPPVSDMTQPVDPQTDGESNPDTEEELTTIEGSSEATQEDLRVEFEGELTVFSEPLRVYSPMWTRTLEDYYAIAPGATFTITNAGKDESAYITVTLVEYIRSADNFFSTVNHDGVMFDADMLGQFWNNDEALWLSDQLPSDLSAGDGLYWSVNEDYETYSQVVKLYPGQSVTLRLPEREQDTVCRLNVQYRKEGEEFPLFARSFEVSADDVSVPVITAY